MKTNKQKYKFDYKFYAELAKFRKKFPECYIESWTPEDFETQNDFVGSCEIVESLYNIFDADQGTNWNLIKLVKENVEI